MKESKNFSGKHKDNSGLLLLLENYTKNVIKKDIFSAYNRQAQFIPNSRDAWIIRLDKKSK